MRVVVVAVMVVVAVAVHGMRICVFVCMSV